MDLLVPAAGVADFCDACHKVLNIQPLITGSKDGSFLELNRTKHTRTQVYLQHLAKLSIKFLNKNPDTIVVPADKGQFAIMDKDSYTKKRWNTRTLAQIGEMMKLKKHLYYRCFPVLHMNMFSSPFEMFQFLSKNFLDSLLKKFSILFTFWNFLIFVQYLFVQY